MALRLRRGTDAERQLITPEAGEPLWIDNEALWIGDGSTVGGIKVTGGIENDLATVSIDALSDVDTTSSAPTNGQTLVWNTNTFEPGLPALTINDLSNVDVVSNPPSNGDSLVWDGASWVPGTPTFTSDGVINGYLFGDMQGSVFADNSSIMVDGVNGLLVGNINSTAATIQSINNQNIEMANVDGEPLIKIISETNTGSFGLPVISINNNHTGTYGQEITFNRSNGTHETPTAAQSGDYSGSITVRAHDGSDFTTIGAMHVVADAVNGTDDVDSCIYFLTRNGSIAGDYGTMLKLGKGAEVSGYVQFGSYTTTERNALTPAFGMVIYNTTTNVFEGYQNTGGSTPEWVALS